MLELLDPSSTRPAKAFVAPLNLTDEATTRIEGGANVRRYIDRLLAEGLTGDALAVIAHTLPVQFAVPWCAECVRAGLEGSGPAIEAERAAVALAEQCLRHPTDDNRALCLEVAERAQRRTAGSWLATAAAWADGHLSPPGITTKVPAPPAAVAAAVVAALRLAAVRPGANEGERLAGFAARALALFGAGGGQS